MQTGDAARPHGRSCSVYEGTAGRGSHPAHSTPPTTCSRWNPFSRVAGSGRITSVTAMMPVSSVTLSSNTSSGLLWPGRDSVSLQCAAHGTDVSYSWNLGDVALPEDPRYQYLQNNGTLIINPISSSDIRSVTCTASNWINKETSDKLDVKLAAGVSAVTLTSNTSAALWAGQDSVSLYCSARGSAITFSWSLNGEPLSPHPSYSITQSDSPPSSNLTISPVSRGADKSSAI
ncbi:hypothetical protein GDO81_007941 [Engystomops pustulosus]|uniref:Ig-like domain-containing protein n=1 Tax=Engystomops pustulosus TaxID=76066 RepID=A0AAV7CAV9_ENGPU|nr:hypothetical protein GDO81_007941 [Engystomops pustulosus]